MARIVFRSALPFFAASLLSAMQLEVRFASPPSTDPILLEDHAPRTPRPPPKADPDAFRAPSLPV